MASNLGVASHKSVQCSICQKKFSRTDHLKRHQLRREILSLFNMFLERNDQVMSGAENKSRFRGEAIFMRFLQ
jgi:hypothetical protein